MSIVVWQAFNTVSLVENGSSQKEQPGWVTLEDGRHIYFGKDGEGYGGKDAKQAYKADEGGERGKLKGGRSYGTRSGPDAEVSVARSGRVEEKVGRSSDASVDKIGQGQGAS